MKNKKSNLKWWLIGAGVLILIILGAGIGMYNDLVSKDVTITEKWGNLESQYQRRIDLIPNLVTTVKAYATHEKELFTKITELRSRWASAKTADDKMAVATGIDEVTKQLQTVINVAVENYPQLKANENFLSLQDELAGTENRVNVARVEYNAAVGSYNKAVRTMPKSIIASMFEFEQKKMFEAAEGAENAPKVTF